jgi:hypothetical protein
MSTPVLGEDQARAGGLYIKKRTRRQEQNIFHIGIFHFSFFIGTETAKAPRGKGALMDLVLCTWFFEVCSLVNLERQMLKLGFSKKVQSSKLFLRLASSAFLGTLAVSVPMKNEK